MVKRTLHALSALLALAAAVATQASFAAIPVRWTTDTFKVKPLAYECYHGETLDLAASLTAYGEPLALGGKQAKLWWQTPDMGETWYETNATVRVDAESGATNVLAAVWSGAYDTGKDTVRGFVGVVGENYRASFELHLKASPGFAPNPLPLPPKTINWAEVANVNVDAAPFVVKGGAGGITSNDVVVIADYEIGAKVADWAMKPNPPPSGGGVTTNAVIDIVSPMTNAAVAAAVSSATNAAKAYADGTFLKTSGGDVTGPVIHYYDPTGENRGYINLTSVGADSMCIYFEEGDDVSPCGYIAFSYVEPSTHRSVLAPDNTPVLTANLATNTFPIVTNAYTRTEANATFAPLTMIAATDTVFSNATVAVVNDMANRSITASVDAALTDILGADWKTTYGGGLAGIIAALVGALAWLKANKVGSFSAVGGVTPTVSGGVADVSSLFSSANTSLGSEIVRKCDEEGYLKSHQQMRYSLGASSSATMADRTINQYAMSADTELVFPASVGNYARDFLLKLTYTSGTMTLPSGVTKVGDDLSFTGGKTYLMTFTEIAANQFYVRSIEIA